MASSAILTIVVPAPADQGSVPTAGRFDHVRIGSRVFPFTSFAEVSAAYRASIESLGLGGSQTPACRIFDATGRQTAYISYNGRGWLTDPVTLPHGSADDVCVYDPCDGRGHFPPRRYAPLAEARA